MAKPRPVDMPTSDKDIGFYWKKYSGDVFIVGSGTSLKGFKYKNLEGKYTIALNNAIKFFQPTWHLYSDCGLHKKYILMDYEMTLMVCQGKAAAALKKRKGFKYTHHVKHFTHTGGLNECTPKDNKLYVQNTVATGAVMMAVKLGFTRIFLLGIDGYCFKNMYYADGSRKGREKHQKAAEDKEGRIIQARHRKWQKQMQDLRGWVDRHYKFNYKKKGTGIFNLSRLSIIDAWPFVKPKRIFPKK